MPVTSNSLQTRAVARQAEEEELRQGWRSIGRAATFVALLTSPAAFIWFYREENWSLWWSILATLLLVGSFSR